jgi:hypothetical protein
MYGGEFGGLTSSEYSSTGFQKGKNGHNRRKSILQINVE